MHLLTTQEAAARLRMSKKTFLKLRLPVSKVSERKYLYNEEDLDAYTRSKLEYDNSSTASSSAGGERRVVKIKQRGAPKVFSPGELSKISVRGGEG